MYIRLSDYFYPLTERQIREAFPNTTFPKPFKKEGYEVVFPSPQPEITNLQRCVEGVPILTLNGTWEQTWNIVNRFETQAEEAAFLAQEAINLKLRIQTQNKADCKTFILSKYSEETQRNAALGIYGETTKSEIADHIARIIMEENRVFDSLKVSDDPQTIEKPIWPEV